MEEAVSEWPKTLRSSTRHCHTGTCTGTTEGSAGWDPERLHAIPYFPTSIQHMELQVLQGTLYHTMHPSPDDDVTAAGDHQRVAQAIPTTATKSSPGRSGRRRIQERKGQRWRAFEEQRTVACEGIHTLISSPALQERLHSARAKQRIGIPNRMFHKGPYDVNSNKDGSSPSVSTPSAGLLYHRRLSSFLGGLSPPA